MPENASQLIKLNYGRWEINVTGTFTMSISNGFLMPYSLGKVGSWIEIFLEINHLPRDANPLSLDHRRIFHVNQGEEMSMTFGSIPKGSQRHRETNYYILVTLNGTIERFIAPLVVTKPKPVWVSDRKTAKSWTAKIPMETLLISDWSSLSRFPLPKRKSSESTLLSEYKRKISFSPTMW